MLRFAFALLLLSVVPSHAMAWGKLGHRLVAELAERRLSPATRAETRRLLEGEADPTLAGIASWADEVRELDAYGWSAPLHYVRIHDPQCRYVTERDCAEGACVVGAIEHYRALLGDRSRSRSERVEALKFVVHFVGDAHQPLHAGQRADKGGNRFQINLAGKPTNLHAIWDFDVIGSAGRDFEAWIEHLTLGASTAESSPAWQWAEASCRASTAAGFYPRRPGRLPDAYLDQQRPLAEKRLREAASQLASLLEHALVSP